MRQRLLGLKELFHQIHPDLRATYVVLVLATLTSFMHRVTTQSMLPLLATAKLGLSPKEVGMLFTISGIAVFTMILPAGYVIDKVGRKWATVPSTGIPAIAFMLIPFADSFFQLAVLIAFLGSGQRHVVGFLGDLHLRCCSRPCSRPAPSGAPHACRDRRGRRASARRHSRR